MSNPGQKIANFIKVSGITIKSLSRKLRISQAKVQQLIDGQIPIDVTLSERLAKVIGDTPYSWRVLDASYWSTYKKIL